MKKMLNIKYLITALVVFILCFAPIATKAQTPGSAAGFGLLGSQIGQAVATASGNQDLAQTYKELGQSYSKAMTISRPEGCKPGDKNACYPYCKYYEYTKDKKDCFLCPVFAVVFNTASTIGATAINAFSNSVVRVVVIAFAIWLAIQILQFASSVETKDVKDLFQTILTQGFVILLVVVIIKLGVSNFSNTFISPVYNTGQSMAQAMYSTCTANQTSESCAETQRVFSQKSKHIKEIANGLPSSMGHSIIQTMTIMEYNVLKYKALGSAMMCQSWEDGYFIMPHFRYMTIGLLIWLLSMMIIIVVPFLMIDSVFQLSVAAALLPIAVGCFAFKSTRKYTKQVWETFLNSMFSFIFISIVVLILLGTIQATISGGISDTTGAVGNFDDMFIMGSDSGQQYFAHLMENMNWGSSPFLKMIFIFLLAWTVMHMAKGFAGTFASSISNTKIGSSIGAMAASSTKGAATKIITPFGRAIGRKGLYDGTQRLTRGILHLTRRNSYRAERQAFNNGKNKVTTNKDGNKTYTDQDGRIHTLEGDAIISLHQSEKITRMDQSGQPQEKTTKSVRTIKNGDLTIIQTTTTVWSMENGQWKVLSTSTVEQTEFNNESIEESIKKDGKVDIARLEQSLQGLSPENRKIAERALKKLIAKKRFTGQLHNFDSAEITSTSEYIDSNTGEMVIRETTSKGDIVFTKQQILANGYIQTTIVKVDSKGRVTTLISDGVRNKMIEDELIKSVDPSTIKTIDEAYANSQKDINGNRNSKISYSYSRYWQNKIDHGTKISDVPQGAMSQMEIEGALGLFDNNNHSIGYFHANKVFDSNGIQIGTYNSDGTITDASGNIILTPADYKSKHIGGEFNQFVHSAGNEFQKGRMNLNFN